MQAEPPVSFHFQHLLLPTGWSDNIRLITRDGRVEGFVTDVAPESGDVRLGCGLPGMPNLHSHAFQRGMAGLAEVRGPAGDSFWTWREVMYRFVGRLDPEQLSSIAALAYIEMLESGFTRVGEFHYLHHDRDGHPFSDPAEMSRAVADAAIRTGIGLTHLPVFYAHSGFGGAEPETHQRRFIHGLDSYARLLEALSKGLQALPDAILGVAPHSLRAVTPEELAQLEDLAGDGPIHIHIAEQVREVEDCVAWSGSRPVEWLLKNAAVGENWCLVHATHLTQPEVLGLAKSGAVAGLCPITEANLGDGIFPASSFAAQNGSFGIGSDSNVLIDMTEELRLLEYGQRLDERSRNIMAGGAGRSTGLDLYQASLAGGSRALGVQMPLTPGASADFVTLATDHPSLMARSREGLVDGLIFAAGKDGVDGVWRRGKQVVSGGRHHGRDAIVGRYRQCLEALVS